MVGRTRRAPVIVDFTPIFRSVKRSIPTKMQEVYELETKKLYLLNDRWVSALRRQGFLEEERRRANGDNNDNDWY